MVGKHMVYLATQSPGLEGGQKTYVNKKLIKD
jgi:hypothetical protein